MQLFDTLGFHWDRNTVPTTVPVYTLEQVCFRLYHILPQFVWDAATLEGNPFTFPEVKTLLDGITVGGRKLSDQEQVLNLAAGTKKLLSLVRGGAFTLNKNVFCELQGIIACNEALEWGHFRGEGSEQVYTPPVALGETGYYYPLATEAGASNLNLLFNKGIKLIGDEIETPLEKAIIFFLFGALQQFFFDGNKRTSRFMMNGLLLSHGIEAINIPATKAQEFNEKMVQFYLHKDATNMVAFLIACGEQRLNIP